MKGLLLLIPALILHADTLDIRGKPQSMAILHAIGMPHGNVLFLPGDGGWRGLAVTLAQRIAGWGYNVYGFDTKHYLESFSALTPEQMSRDLNTVISWAHARGGTPVTLFGWSQGASMGILAATSRTTDLDGLITLGLPETGVLSWNWKDMFAAAARLRPDEPYFAVEPLLQKTATPVWMIYGTADEYTSLAVTDRMFAAAKQPKQIVKVRGANHRFDSRTAELTQALQDGLSWVQQAHSAKPR